MKFSDEYKDALKSQHWKNVKASRLRKVGGCEKRRKWKWIVKLFGTGCEGRLEGHHRTYKRLGFEKPGDIQMLCAKHHAEVERKKQKARKKKAVNSLRRTHYKKFGRRLSYSEAERRLDAWVADKVN